MSRERRITGRNLDDIEELIIKLKVLIDLLEDKGVLTKKELERLYSMKLHEYSKATSFESLDEEL